MVVAVAVGRSGIDALLVASQVVLAIVLPFVTLPLIFLTSSKDVMIVREPREISTDLRTTSTDCSSIERPIVDPEHAMRLVDFSSGKFTTGIGLVIWLVMVLANAYVIVMLAMGKGG